MFGKNKKMFIYLLCLFFGSQGFSCKQASNLTDLGEGYNCRTHHPNPLYPQPKLIYPMELVVSNDGKTVYAINSGCNGLGFLPPDILPKCTPLNKYLFRQKNVIFQISENTIERFLLNQGDSQINCGLGKELEMDGQNNLYFMDTYNPSIEELTSQQQLSSILKIGQELSEAKYYDIELSGGVNINYFNLPQNFYILKNKLYYYIYAQADISDYSIRILDLTTHQASELKGLTEDKNFIHNPLVYSVWNEDVYVFSDNIYSSEQIARGETESKYALYTTHRKGHAKGAIFIKNPPQEVDLHAMRAVSEHLFYVSDRKNHMIWKLVINESYTHAELLPLAGSGDKGYRDETGDKAAFYVPTALSLDGSGNLYVADTGNHAIRKITPEGVVTTFYKEIAPAP